MKNAVIYIHGKGGTAEESVHYRSLFVDCDVIGFDYRAQTPWEAKTEFSEYFDSLACRYRSVSIIANSIGAYFAMNALSEKNVAKAYLISPIADMEKLIGDMLNWANVSEEALCSQGEITTDFNETLSWEYLCYVRDNPICWQVPTHILYGENDDLTTYETIKKFADDICATLTVMKGGEHWFHTTEQMDFLDNWIITNKDD